MAKPNWFSTPAILKSLAISSTFFSVSLLLTVLTSARQNQRLVVTMSAESTPSIVAAQRLKESLASSNTLATVSLLNSAAGSDLTAQFVQSMRPVNNNLFLAIRGAQNEASQGAPAKDLQLLLQAYYGKMEQALLAHRKGESEMARLRFREAEVLFTGYLMPYTDRLDATSTNALNQAFLRHAKSADDLANPVILSALLSLAILIATQIFLAKKFHRLLNLPLLLSTISLSGLTLLALVNLHVSAAQIQQAKSSAFDSLHALSKAKARLSLAQSAFVSQLLDPQGKGRYDSQYRTQMLQLVRLRSGNSFMSAANALQKGQSVYPLMSGDIANFIGTASSAAERKQGLAVYESFINYATAAEQVRGTASYSAVNGAATASIASQLERVDSEYRASLKALDRLQKHQEQRFDQLMLSASSKLQMLQIVAYASVTAALILALIGLRIRLSVYSA